MNRPDSTVRSLQALTVIVVGAGIGWSLGGDITGAAMGAAAGIVGIPILDWWMGGVF